MRLFRHWGSNFNSVYYVDVDHDKVYAYKVNSAVRSVLNDTLKAIPGYEAIMAEYVGKVVLTEDRETMLYETSIENLRKQLSMKKHISMITGLCGMRK